MSARLARFGAARTPAFVTGGQEWRLGGRCSLLVYWVRDLAERDAPAPKAKGKGRPAKAKGSKRTAGRKTKA